MDPKKKEEEEAAARAKAAADADAAKVDGDGLSMEEKARRYDDEQHNKALTDLAERKADEIAREVLAKHKDQDAFLAGAIERALERRLPRQMKTAADASWKPRLMFPAGVPYPDDEFGRLTPGQKQLADKMMIAVSQGQKSLNTQVAGQGAEFVPTLLDNELIEWIAEESACRRIFEVVKMPSDPYVLPVTTAGVSVYKASGECSSTTTSQPTTAARTMNAEKLIADVELCEEFNEDSVIAAVPMVQRDIARAFAEQEENAWINGDINTVGNISGVAGNGNSSRELWNGIRRTIYDGNAAWRITGAGGMVAAYRALEAALGRYWSNPQRCVWLIESRARVTIGQQLEFTSLEKIGPGYAFNITGLAGIFDGTPTAMSGLLPAVTALEIAAGVTTGYLSILAHRDAVKLGQRRGLTIKMDFDIRRDALYIVGTERIAIAFPYGAGSLGYVYNYP